MEGRRKKDVLPSLKASLVQLGISTQEWWKDKLFGAFWAKTNTFFRTGPQKHPKPCCSL